MVLSLWKFSGAHEAGGDQFADFECKPTRSLVRRRRTGIRLAGDICCDPERSAV
jgi:hypothetical protein